MTSRPAPSMSLHVALSLASLFVLWLLLPPETAVWRKVLSGILGVGFGFQVALAIGQVGAQRAVRMRAWLEALSFPLLVAAFQLLPQTSGWILVVAALGWRALVAATIPVPTETE